MGSDTHVRYIHKNIRSHQCHICPYSAKSASMLRLHIRAHEVHVHLRAAICTFTCVQRYQLKSHMRTHTKEKPYKCTMCSYAAAWNVQLKEHIKAHSMSTAVACRECGVVLKNTHTLSIHEKKEHASVWQYNHPPNTHPLALTASSATAPHTQQHPAVMGQ
ncbi:zinc finger protein 64-like [Dreissena polymorpha]|uniref:zinc finger protein 64-like n=1 Tax=Dreissena polymorpha TaxID=45954 RepID=UPI002265525D|nr:zinc finger protein 64-like [Dreissena polymorpha]